MSDKECFGCIEMGGTTVSVAVANEMGSFLWKKRGIPSASPCDTHAVIKEVCETLQSSGYQLKGIGIASFGPLDIANGNIGNTPKGSWKQFPLVKEIQKYFPGIPIVLETDVNAPAYSEYLAIRENTDPNAKSVCYLTVGTGVGGGVFSDGRSYHGLMHPEFGHVLLQKYEGDTYKGECPFHGACLEGLSCAKALSERLNITEAELPSIPNDHPIWDLFAFYIGQAASIAGYCYSADYFVVGGGIMTGEGREYLYDKANEYCKKFINGYITPPKVVPPHYLRDAGLVGAYAVISHKEVFEH